VLIRIRLVENVKLAREPDDFFPYVRIGAAGAGGNKHLNDPDLDRPNAFVASGDVFRGGLSTDTAVVKMAGEPVSFPVPMRPEFEFPSENEPEFLPGPQEEEEAAAAATAQAQAIASCKPYPNWWESVFGTIHDFLMDFFGRIVEAERLRCKPGPPPLQDPRHYSALSSFPPTSSFGGGGVNYHRNGSPIGDAVRHLQIFASGAVTLTPLSVE